MGWDIGRFADFEVSTAMAGLQSPSRWRERCRNHLAALAVASSAEPLIFGKR